MSKDLWKGSHEGEKTEFLPLQKQRHSAVQ